jgi:hypothetical protein
VESDDIVDCDEDDSEESVDCEDTVESDDTVDSDDTVESELDDSELFVD